MALTDDRVELFKRKIYSHELRLTGALPCFVVLGLIEEGAGDHGEQQQSEAAGHSLSAREGAAVRSHETRQPQVRVRDLHPRTLLEELIKGQDLGLGHWRHGVVDEAVFLVPGKPSLEYEVVSGKQAAESE